jgi:DNA-binding LacI/PurR family transcriptional regulator
MSERGRRIAIGLFVQSFGNEYSTGLLRALHASAQQRDVNLIAFVGGDYRSVHQYAEQRNLGFQLAHPRNVDGLLVLQIGTHVTPAELGQFISRFAPLPACTIGVKCPGLPCVSLDNERAVRELMRHLIVEHQRRQILFISGPVENNEVQRRFEVYQDSLRTFDIPFREELVLNSEFASDEAREVVASHLAAEGLKFDAVMAATDTIAIGALAALHDAGVRVPDEVSVMGFDDISEAWTTHPPLSTVRQPWRVQADAALDALLAQIAGDAAFETMLVSAELVPRRSCGCFESSIEHAGGASMHPEPARSSASSWRWANYWEGLKARYVPAGPSGSPPNCRVIWKRGSISFARPSRSCRETWCWQTSRCAGFRRPLAACAAPSCRNSSRPVKPRSAWKICCSRRASFVRTRLNDSSSRGSSMLIG